MIMLPNDYLTVVIGLS